MDDLRPGPGHWGRAFFGALYRGSTIELLADERTQAEVRVIGSLLALPPGARVLDAGCGHGRHAVALAGQRLRVVGLDLDEPSLAMCGALARSAGVRVPLVRADLAALPLAPASFDGVYAWYSSLFLFDDAANAAVLRSLARSLRPGGRLVAQSIDPAHLALRPDGRVELPLRRGGRVVEHSRFDARTGRDEGVRRVELPGGEVLEARFSIRYHGAGELTELAGAAGLTRARCVRGSEVGLAPEVLILVGEGA